MKRPLLVSLVVLIVFMMSTLVGCGAQEETTTVGESSAVDVETTQAEEAENSKEVVSRFLEAVKAGNDVEAAACCENDQVFNNLKQVFMPQPGAPTAITLTMRQQPGIDYQGTLPESGELVLVGYGISSPGAVVLYFKNKSLEGTDSVWVGNYAFNLTEKDGENTISGGEGL